MQMHPTKRQIPTLINKKLFLVTKCSFFVSSKNQQRLIDTLQVDLETEVRHKIEALKNKKKLEQAVSDLEGAVEAANRAKVEVGVLDPQLYEHSNYGW